MQKVISDDQIALLRDTQDGYNILERKFGMLTQGHTFGESFMLGGSDKNRFFNAIALTETIVLTLKKDNYDTAMQAIDRRIY